MRIKQSLLIVLIVVGLIGCHQGPRRGGIIVDPGMTLVDPIGSEGMLMEPAPQLTFVDRHPLLYKPVEYYQTGGESQVARIASATFIGVPAGVVGQVRQIVRGTPPGF